MVSEILRGEFVYESGGMDRTYYYREQRRGGRSVYCMTIFVGMQPPIEVDLRQYRKEFVSFGRYPDNDLVLQSPNVSKHHGFFRLTPNGVYVEDMDSTNGILINGRKAESGILREGDILRIDDEKRSVTSGVLFFFNTASGKYSWKKRTDETAGTADRA